MTRPLKSSVCPSIAAEKCHRGQIRDDQGRFAASVTHGAGGFGLGGQRGVRRQNHHPTNVVITLDG